MVLLIDHFDSFTWNIVHVAARCAPGVELRVLRADQASPATVTAFAPTGIILSPGPCGPQDAPGTLELLAAFAGRVPILGVCLGHQCIAHAFGMRVNRAPRPIHGKTSPIAHDALGVFAGLPSPLTVMRYHSLAVDPASINTRDWTISAATAGPTDPAPVVMGLRRRWNLAPLEGVQFHPESFATPLGGQMLANFLAPAQDDTIAASRSATS